MSDRFFVCAVACVALVGCAAEPEPAAPAPETQATTPVPDLPAMIVAERGGFIPEGVEYDQANGRLLTGSLAEGTIFQIHNDGRVSPSRKRSGPALVCRHRGRRTARPPAGREL